MKPSTIASVGAWMGILTAVAHGQPSAGQPPASQPADRPTATPSAEKLGWRLGLQTYSLRNLTFFETVDKAAALGLKYVEIWPGQKLSAELGGGFGPGMKPETAEKVKAKLAAAGVRIVCMGVVGLPGDEKGLRRLFEFCKDMAIEVITCNLPPRPVLDLCEKIGPEYGVAAAIHNHASPKPEEVDAAVKGRGKWAGACVDIGHWRPRKMEALKMLAGHIVSLHYVDRPWGKDEADAKATLLELRRQNWTGCMIIEYEWANPEADLARCVPGVEKLAAEILAEESKAPVAETRPAGE